MKKQLSILILVLFPFLLSAQNTWEKKTSFPGSKRARSVAFAIGNRGYMACGEDTLDIEKNDLWEYDPGSDSWTQKASLPGPGRRDAVGFAIGLKGYVGTGIDAPLSAIGNVLTDFWEYSPITNAWVSKASFPGSFNQCVYMATGFVVNTKGYIVGGKIGPSYYSSELWEFNPATNTWLQKTSFPPGVRLGQAAFSLNGKGYVGCGTDENWLNNDFWEYNPATNGWTQKANFPGTQRSFLTALAMGGKGYMGFGEDGGYKDDWYEYNATTDSWSVKGPYGSEGRRSSPSFVITGAGYIMCGKGVSGKHRDLWCYQPYIISVEENNLTSVNVYPNPAAEIIKFDIDENFVASHENLSIEIMSTDGKIVSRQSINGKSHVEIQNENWNSGIYLFTLTDGTTNYGGGRVVVR